MEGVCQSWVISGSTSHGTGRKINHHKLAAKENNGRELVPAGGWGGRSTWQNLEQEKHCQGVRAWLET